MTQIFKAEFFKKNIYLFIIFYIMLIPIIASVWSSFLGISVSSGVSYEEFIIIVGFTLTTYYYQKYKREDYLKISYLSGMSKNTVKIYLLLFLFIILFILSYLFILIIYLMWHIGFVPNIGITGYVQNLPTLSQMNWLFFTYCIVMYILFVVGIAYILNHFLKLMTFIFGFMVILCFFDLRFSLTILAPLSISSNNFFEISSRQYEEGLKMWTFYVMPWSMIGIRFSELFYENTFVHMNTFSQLYSLDYATEYQNFEWIPYVYLIVIYSLPIIFWKNPFNK